MTRKKLFSDLENRRDAKMKLQRWQARKINRALQPAVGYLCRLRERMEKVGLDNDPLF
jgi:hypothetical protein